MGFRSAFSQLGCQPKGIVFEAQVTSEDVGSATLFSMGSAFEGCLIDWGDGTSCIGESIAQGHLYNTAGTYVVHVSYETGLLPKHEHSGNAPIKYGFRYCNAVWNTENFTNNYKDNQNFCGIIPPKIFCNNPDIQNIQWCFRNSGVTGRIPKGLVAHNPSASKFSLMFQACRGLTGGIPADIFCNCANETSLNGVFQSCSGLSGDVPYELFNGCNAVANISNTFRDCTGLTGVIPKIPTTVTNMEGTFLNASGFTSVTETLWESPWSVSSYTNCFANCNATLKAQVTTAWGGTMTV